MREPQVPSLSGRYPWRKKQLPTPVFLPGEFYGQRSLAGYSPRGHKESDTTEQLSLSLFKPGDRAIQVCEDGRVFSLAVSPGVPAHGGAWNWISLGAFGFPEGQPHVSQLWRCSQPLPSVQGSLASVPFKITLDWDFPGDRVVKTLPSNARGVGSIHSWGAKISHAL